MLLGNPGIERGRRREVPRSLIALACMAAGFLLARHAWLPMPSAAWFGAAAGLCALAMVLRAHACKIALALSVVALSAGWFTARLLERPAHRLDVRLRHAEPPVLVKVQGLVLERPRELVRERTPLDPPLSEARVFQTRLAARYLVADDGSRIPVSGIVRVRAQGSLPEHALAAGDFVTLAGRFQPLAPPLNPGERDQRLWRGQEGVVGSMRIMAQSAEQTESPGGLWSARAALVRLRSAMAVRARDIILGKQAPPSEGRALLGALLLGEEDPALREARGVYQRLGLVHALSISGFHLMVMAAVVLLALRLAGDLGWLEPLLACILIALYLALLPVNAPVWRAGLMACGLLAADALGRRYDRLAVLGWIAILLLVWRPMDLWSIGFQLSFGLVAVLIAMGEIAHQRLWGLRILGTVDEGPRTFTGIAVEHAKRLITANVLCWGVALPIIMYHTGIVSLAAVPAGVVMVPAIALLLVFGYAALTLGVIVPPLGESVAALAEAAADASLWLTRIMDAAPAASVHGPVVSLAWTIAATLLMAYWVLRGHGRDLVAWSLTLVCCAWLAGEAWLRPRPPGGAALRIDALAVGDGSCMLVRAGNAAVLWDCGSLDGRIGEILVPRSLRALGVSRIPVAVITHPNLDHFNGLLDVLEPLGIRTVIIGAEFQAQAQRRPHSAEAYVLEALAQRGIQMRTVTAGEELIVDDLRFEFLSPPAGAEWRPDNDMSLVAAVSASSLRSNGPVPLLLTGDIESGAMSYLRARHPDLRAQVVEAPHHGSARPLAVEFVWSLQPEAVLQSTGPQRAGLALWEPVRARVDWMCTATNGASWAAIYPSGKVETGSHRTHPNK